MNPKLFKAGFKSLFLKFLCLCLASNTAQVACQTIDISVVNGSLPDLANFEEGGNLALRCEVTGQWASSDFVITWQYETDVVSWDGELRMPYAGPRFSVEVAPLPGRGDTSQGVAHDLTISPVQPGDSGDYSCIVLRQEPTNPMLFSEVISQTVTLMVSYFPDETNPMCKPNGPTDVNYGNTLLLACSTDKGNPEVQLTLTEIGSFNSGPWSIIRDSDTLSQELLLSEVSTSSNGSLFICAISSPRFPEKTRFCRVGPLNVVQPSTETQAPTVNSAGPGDPLGPQSTTTEPPPQDPACFGWLIAFIVAAVIATLSIILNVVFLTVRQMRKDRKYNESKEQKSKDLELTANAGKTSGPGREEEAYSNIAVSAD